jgi:polysaccharide export outer membrane protein
MWNADYSVSFPSGVCVMSIVCANRWLVAALIAFTLFGCAGSAVDSSETGGLATASPTGEYLIGPGDTLEIIVWRQEDLSVTVPVRPDGRISTPLVEDLVAVNKTPTQLAREIESALSTYVRSPQVNVIVQNFVGTPGAQVRVLGQAVQPRTVPYRDRMTLLDLILEAGGLTEFAAGNRSRVIRNVDGESREIRVRLDNLVKRGDVGENILLAPGDIVIIPEAVF